MAQGPHYLKPACPFCGYSLKGLRGSACPECGRSLLGRGEDPASGAPLRTVYVSVGVSLLIASVAGTALARGGILGFLFGLAFAALPFAVLLLLVRFVSRPRSVVEALVLAILPSMAVMGLLLSWYYDAMVVHPDAQGGLVFIFAPIYSVPVAVGAWVMGFFVILLKRAVSGRSGPRV